MWGILSPGSKTEYLVDYRKRISFLWDILLCPYVFSSFDISVAKFSVKQVQIKFKTCAVCFKSMEPLKV